MLASTSNLIKKYDLAAKKSLGQNFILDKNFTDKIARLSGNIRDREILEIGPGPGSLTRSILDQKPKKLIAIERDQRCIKVLEEIKSYYPTLEIIEEDALKINELQLFQNNFSIIANLPYNIGTVLIFKWLKIYQNIDSMHLMLQKEVAERIVAKKGSKHYGRLAIMVNFLCETRIALEVKKSVFTPPPKVTSAIVEIIPRSKPLFDANFKKLEKVTSIAFSQKRKKIKSPLKAIFKNPEKTLEECNIDSNIRAENLTIEDFCNLSNLL
ncbi:MAG: 16S rRNA (adenine(1518)-N(6)/adenine(1519)-N(6))-dimethyltransferase RsmA [Rickettsiales bacterium]|nr:16S rRNA (adenine(1518)-N(6)/adenine(1519)-N(6))-dimethyltransferase RsmA [Rickettsiales bacterium]